MKINSINTNSYSNIKNNHKLYATRPVFKQSQTDSVVSPAILEAFVESSNDKKNKNNFVSKINFLKDVLFSDENTRHAQQLKKAIESYDSTQNILYNA